MADEKKPGWGTVTIPLRNPFMFGGTTCSSVVIRNPTGADYLRFMRRQGTFQERVVALAIDLIEQPEDFFAAMEGRDCATVLDAVGNFTLPYQAT